MGTKHGTGEDSEHADGSLDDQEDRERWAKGPAELIKEITIPDPDREDEVDTRDINPRTGRIQRPTQKQIRYYTYLCNQLGVPYEASHQMLYDKFRTARLLSERIQDLRLMLDYKKMHDSNKEEAGWLALALKRGIEQERLQIEEEDKDFDALKEALDSRNFKVKDSVRERLRLDSQGAGWAESLSGFLRRPALKRAFFVVLPVMLCFLVLLLFVFR